VRRVTCVLVVAHYRGSERTCRMTAGSLCAHCVVGSLMCSVMGCGGPAGGGCVLFEKCIVDASISHMRVWSGLSGSGLLFVWGMNIAISL
jgi:hypothetical protein